MTKPGGALRRVATFEPVALLDLLEFLDYKREQVFFESEPSALSPATFVHALELESDPIDYVVVKTGFGLLGPHSPLPSYFRQLLEDGQNDEQLLLSFLRFFDHGLIRSFLDAIYPERDKNIVRDWDATKKCYLKLLGIRSVATLHQVFELAFPELEVDVTAGPLDRRVQLEPARLGGAQLGAAILGGFSRVPVPGYKATLYSDEERLNGERPWADEVRRRLDAIVFPALEDPGVDLSVSLVLRSEKVFAGLRPGTYLGFDRLKGGEARSREVHIWGGLVAPGVRARPEGQDGERP